MGDGKQLVVYKESIKELLTDELLKLMEDDKKGEASSIKSI